MKKLLLIAILLWANIFSQGQVIRQLNSTPDDAEIRELVNKYVVSINNADSISGYSLFAHSGKISFIHTRGNEQSWEEIKRNIYKFLSDTYSIRKLKIDYEDVWLLECAARVVISYTFNATSNKDNSNIQGTYIETQLWWKTNEEWKLSAVHDSNINSNSGQQFF